MEEKPKDRLGTLLDKLSGTWKNTVSKIGGKASGHRKAVSVLSVNYQKISMAIAIAVCALAVSLVIVGFATPKTVTVNIDDSVDIVSKEYKTTSLQVKNFLENYGIDFVEGEDIIDVDLDDAIVDGLEINIQKAVDISVTADGETQVVRTIPVTVSELLEQIGLEVGDDDIVEPSLDHVLVKGDELQIKRVTTEYVSEVVTEDYSVTYVNDYSLAIGDTEITQNGVTGETENTYLVTYVDGVETSRTLAETKVITEKQDQIISIGMNISSGIPEGLEYKAVYTGVRAVSYYFSGNPRGSYGLPCTYGTCAVDPDLIPLGSLLYIEGYGYAIANDVGTSIKGKTVDLYMEDLSQCYVWGARTVTVYVIS